MNGPDPGHARADATGSTDDVPRLRAPSPDARRLQSNDDLSRFLMLCHSAPQGSQAVIDAFDRSTRAAWDEARRLAAAFDAAIEPVRSAIQRIAEALQGCFDARRKHPDHVIDDAYIALSVDLPSTSNEERIRAALAAFRRCKPMRSSKVARANLGKGERVSAVAHAMRAIAKTWIAHPRLRRILATAIAKELRELQPDELTQLVGRLDRDACAVATRRWFSVSLESVQEGSGASQIIENNTIADALAAAETVSAVRDAAEELRRSGPANAAALDYLTGDDARKDVAARYGLTERQVRCAEVRVRRRLETRRRRVE